VVVSVATWGACSPASARGQSGTTCSSGGGAAIAQAGAGCSAAPVAHRLLAGRLSGPDLSLGSGVAGVASTAGIGLALTAIGAAVAASANFVLKETAHILGQTTAPRLDGTWFSNAYWRVAGIASVLTLPFLFAASVQALIRSDLTLLVRAAAGYLPIATLTVAVAAPVTMLLLSASDQLAGVVSSAAGHDGLNFLARLTGPLDGLSGISGSPFLGFLIGLFTVAGALMLWIELLIRQAGVYVIVLLLPVAFAAFVWPARRIWAIRSVELLVALILSKFVIVAVLSLGAAALGHSLTDGLTTALAGVVLLVLGAFAPWALLRLIPLAELASAAAGGLRGQAGTGVAALRQIDTWAASEKDRWATKTAAMRRSSDAEPTRGTEAPRNAEPAAATAERSGADPAGGTEARADADPPGDNAPVAEPPTPGVAERAPTPSLAADEAPEEPDPKPDGQWITRGDAWVHLPASFEDPSGQVDR
jgi:hypothetical protein